MTFVIGDMESKKTILIIDDNENDYLLIKRYIRYIYKTVYSAGNEDVINLIENYKPYCILIDYHLGTQKGIDLLKQIKESENEYINTKPIIMLTGETSPEVIVECMKNNATDYIIKGDYNKDGIIRIINQAIEKADLKREIIEQKKEKRKLENLLNHNRRVNSIGQLAGGIAHDFNNIVAGILGAAELLKLPERNLDETSHEYVDMIIKASNRTSSLVGKLLAYGRKGRITSSVLNIDDIISDTISILKSTIMDKKISIVFEESIKNNKSIGDGHQLQNALMNIIINSSQAMPNSGEINIKTENIYLDNSYCKNSSFNIKKGKYIKIIISDTGIGILPENINKIFEPFYTTKDINKGTGLGLSAVYGTILDHYGEITLTSEVGIGTTFYILLPCIENIKNFKTSEKEFTSLDCHKIAGKGLLLLVDDEEIIRLTGKKILEHMGYEVLTAIDGEDALSIYKEQYKKISIIIMDMLMPRLNGKEAFLEMKKINKNCKVIISSGFLKDNDIDELKEMGLSGFIHKPYRSNELSDILRKVLK